jgi:hypothetical protein
VAEVALVDAVELVGRGEAHVADDGADGPARQTARGDAGRVLYVLYKTRPVYVVQKGLILNNTNIFRLKRQWQYDSIVGVFGELPDYLEIKKCS